MGAKSREGSGADAASRQKADEPHTDSRRADQQISPEEGFSR